MDRFSDDSWLVSSSFPVSYDAHCSRVSALAKELGRLSSLRGGAGLLESLAWLHDCPPQLLSDSVLIPDAGDASRKTVSHVLGEQIAGGIKSFQGAKTGSNRIALAAEIVSLANSLDEMLEWRQFEYQTVAQIFEELPEINYRSVWRPEVDAALRLMSVDLLQKAVAAGDSLPVSALAVVRSLATVPTELLTIETLCRAVSVDPALAGDLLRVVNSWGHPMLRGRVSSVRKAIWHLGTEQTRSVLMAAASRTLFASNAIRGLWKHSVHVAEIASELAMLCGCDPEEAFLAGLLHDVGRLAIEKLDQTLLEVRSRLMEQGIPPVWVDLVTCWHDHGEIGGALLEKWNLPLGLVDAVKFHHLPERSDGELTSVVYLAELRSGGDEDFHSAPRLDYALDVTGLSLAEVQEAGIGNGRTSPALLAC
jgi:putative nucleotidyltransferase with HDIG domain